MNEVLEMARTDAAVLAGAGFPALMVENFGDVPFFADSTPPETTSAMTLAAAAIIEETSLPLGINVLRNDALTALAIAAATGARFVRVNVLTGLMYTDQGPIAGRAADVARKRNALATDVEVWADVMVKHATPPPGLEIGQAAADTVERGLADAVIVSGSGTGAFPDPDDARAVRKAVPKGTRIVIGSGVEPSNLTSLTEIADSFIVGSSLKHDGEAQNRVDEARARRLIQSAQDVGLI
jgi:membrane complex biogenesis BtpA family protein